jgi:serine/threonine-protein kinase
VQGSDFPEFIGRYKIKDRLGKGGQGVVYLADHPTLGIEVAVKVLISDNPDFMERFKLDALVLAQLNAPNIVRIYDFDPQEGYLVMEFCRGGDLNDLIKMRRPQPLRRIVALTKQICDALTVAHGRADPVLHRDLKPGNVLFDNDVPKVTDFGLAKVLGDQTSGLTMSHGMMGTAAYASPEQLQDASKVDSRTDLWAVGVILYELMTFHGPFESVDDDNVFQTAMRVVQSPPIEPRYALPRPIWEVIERALSKQREQRYASAKEISQAIDAAFAAIPEAERDRCYPPESALTELDQLAKNLSESVDSGSLENAYNYLAEMRVLSRDASVTRYWTRKLRERGDPDHSISSSSAAPTRTGPGADSGASASLQSIDRLASQYRYADGRRECGKLLVTDPNNDAVHNRLLRLANEERELNDALAEGKKNAASAQGDPSRLIQIWSELDSRFPKHPEITKALEAATSARDEGQRQAASDQARAAAAAREKAGDLAGALEILDAHLRDHASDGGLSNERERIRGAHAAQTQKQRIGDLRATARNAAGGAPEAALAAWQAILDELPTDEEAHRETERIRQAAVAARLAQAIKDADERAKPHLAKHAYGPAIAVWRAVQQQYPGDSGIRDRISRLEKGEKEYRKRSLAETLAARTDQLAAANDAGRYNACKGLAERLAKTVNDARVALRGDIEALNAAQETLGREKDAAETALAKRLQTLRAELLKRLHEAVEMVPGEPGTEAEKTLSSTVAGVTRVLCESDDLTAAGNPLAGHVDARTSIETAVQGVATERRAETEKAKRHSDAAVKAAENAMQKLAASSAANTEAGRALAERMESVRGKADSRSANVLDQVAAEATELAHLAVGARVRGEWERLQQTRQALAGATELIAAGASGRLEEHSRACLDLLKGKPGAGSAEKQDRALAALIQESETQRKTLEEVQSGAARVWQQAVEKCAGLGDSVADDLEKQIDASRRAGKKLTGKDLDREARRLEALVARAQVETAWASQAGALRGLEEGSDAAAVSPGVRDLIADYNGAVARGDAAQMRKLGSRIASDSGTKDSGPVEVPQVSAGMRRFNQRMIPDALARYDAALAAWEKASSSRRGDASETAFAAAQAHRALVSPPPAWRRWAPAGAAALLVAAAAYAAIPPGQPMTVRFVSPIAGVSVNVAGPVSANLNVGPDGTTWEAAAGTYTATTDHGASVEFSVPGDDTVLIPGPAADHTSELADRLGLSELLEDE